MGNNLLKIIVGKIGWNIWLTPFCEAWWNEWSVLQPSYQKYSGKGWQIFGGKAGKTIAAATSALYLAFPLAFVKVSQESSDLEYLPVACVCQSSELALFCSRQGCVSALLLSPWKIFYFGFGLIHQAVLPLDGVFSHHLLSFIELLQ